MKKLLTTLSIILLAACSGQTEVDEPYWVQVQDECEASGGYSRLDFGEDIETGDTVITVGCIL